MDMFMKRISTLLSCLVFAGLSAIAQPKTIYLGPLEGVNPGQKGFSYQGMDVKGRTAVSLQNQGIATVYRLSGKGKSVLGQFRLDSFSKANHANVASFGPWKASRKDPLPLLYVSHCSKKQLGNYKDPCYVERIAPDYSSSELVQTIVYDDTEGDFGYALQWVVDLRRSLLLGYGNTIGNSDPFNKHRVIVFPLPKPSDGPLIILHREDALEDYLIEDVSDFRFNPVGQGLYVRRGKLYMPTGLGTAGAPSVLYVWDLRKHTMEEVFLGDCTTGELEDISMTCGRFVLQGQDGMWILK